MEREVIAETLPPRFAEIRCRMADLAQALAEHEERFADYLDRAALRGDREWRLELAARERGAAVEHRLLANECRQAPPRFVNRPAPG